MSERPLATSAAAGAGGSLSTLLLWLLKESWGPGQLPPVFEHLPCQCPDWDPPKLDFWAGLALGILLWPLVELIVLVKQWATLYLRNRITAFSFESGGKHYRVLG